MIRRRRRSITRIILIKTDNNATGSEVNDVTGKLLLTIFSAILEGKRMGSIVFIRSSGEAARCLIMP